MGATVPRDPCEYLYWEEIFSRISIGAIYNSVEHEFDEFVVTYRTLRENFIFISIFLVALDS